MWKKWLWGSLATLAGLLVVTLIVFSVSPWAGAMVIREIFQQGAKKVSEIMAPYAPGGIDAVLDIQYADGSNQPFVSPTGFTQLDVFYPEGTTAPLGTVIWTHGGAWVSGNKSNDRVYFELLASQGYTVVGLNYTYGPEATYPTALFEINQAHQFLLDHALEYHIDTNKIVLAGDSAGAQITSQIATLITNPTYATEMHFTPALSPEQLQGVVLNCGVYDVTTLIGAKGLLGWGDDMSLWAYTGDRDLSQSEIVKQMSTIDFVTSDFPATYISGGNDDPLTPGNSKPFAKKLESLKVPVDALFWPEDYTPKLPHEYQFHLNLEAAQEALKSTVSFLNQHIGAGS